MTIALDPAANVADAARIRDAIAHLERYGFCLFEDLLPPDQADAMARDFLALHQDPHYRQWIAGNRPYETLFGMLNHDARVWTCAADPHALAVVRHFLGPQARLAEAASKPTWPSPELPIGLHVDSARSFVQVPDVPWLINSMWMLTDFTVENGATGVVPMSHLSRRATPYPDIGPASPALHPVTGRKGSLFLWHSGLFHTIRPNCSDAVRVGLNICYVPPWYNLYAEAGHQPVWPETAARMPAHVRALLPQRQGRSRAEVYETA